MNTTRLIAEVLVLCIVWYYVGYFDGQRALKDKDRDKRIDALEKKLEECQ